MRKVESLGYMIEPIIEDLELTVWFSETKRILDKPSIKTEHGWGLILPKDSPLTPIIVGEKKIN